LLNVDEKPKYPAMDPEIIKPGESVFTKKFEKKLIRIIFGFHQ